MPFAMTARIGVTAPRRSRQRPIPVVTQYGATADTPHDHVVQRAGRIETRYTWHGHRHAYA